MYYLINMINIFGLNKSRDEKEIKRYRTYRKILEKIHKRLETNSDKNLSHCLYTIPKMVLGLPAYDQIKCAEYCIDRLKKNGFVVIYTYPNLLFISWRHVPSVIKNPEVKNMEIEIKTNPYKDYSNLIYNLHNSSDKDQLEYFNSNLLEYTTKDDKLEQSSYID